MGTAFAATFSNLMPKERLHKLVDDTKPMVALTMIILIINLGAPLDYNLILGAGVLAKQGFKLAGELDGSVEKNDIQQDKISFK